MSVVERERTPEWAIQVGTRYHLASMSTRDASDLRNNNGDSGGPVYKIRTDSFSSYTYIGGILRGGNPAQATKMTLIEDEFSVSVVR